jgi:hypothetical protein
MANPEHVEILKQGIKVWNMWRRENESIKPDLTGAIMASPKTRRNSVWWGSLRLFYETNTLINLCS